MVAINKLIQIWGLALVNELAIAIAKTSKFRPFVRDSHAGSV